MYHENVIPLWQAFFVFLTSPIIVGLLYKVSKDYNLFIDNANSKTHSMHNGAVPRAGGIGIYLSTVFLLLNPLGKLFFIASIPVFFIGFLEDYKRDIPPKVRLAFMVISAFLAMYLLNAIVTDLDYVQLPLIIGVIFSLIGIIGVINAINIVDGLNGLASGISILAFLSFSFVAYVYGDLDLAFISFILAIATLGFFIYNFPHGKLFLGDTGSYFLGFSLAVLSILLVNRNPEISSWFPLVVLIYPIWEVLFSIFRRKLIEKRPAMAPDKNHLHCVLCDKLLRANHISSFFILMSIMVIDVLAIILRENTLGLTLLTITFVIFYILIYINIAYGIRFRVNIALKNLGFRIIYITKLFL